MLLKSILSKHKIFDETIFLKRIRETRPDLANQSDKALTSIFSKIRPDIFQNELTKPVSRLIPYGVNLVASSKDNQLVTENL